MQKDKLTFNDLPEVVGELCERIASMETLLAEKLQGHPCSNDRR